MPVWAEKGREDREDAGRGKGNCLPIPPGEAAPSSLQLAWEGLEAE